MTGNIYLVKGDSELVAMRESGYDSEDLLQDLLARYPDLLAGDQFGDKEPRRWLFVSREYGVPDEQDGTGRWSLDHLFLDQDGIPTLIEVKRSSDTRIRREVVGQMLDYAANAVAYWPIEEIRLKFEARCEAEGESPDEALSELLGAEGDPAAFWQQTKTNLQAGRVRLVFVADVIPAELRRIVEFLNEQMDPAEVLAVEVRQYIGEGMQTLVPQVIGVTESAKVRKKQATTETRQWDGESFFADLAQRRNPAEVSVARRLLEWAQEHQLRVWWGKGAQDGSFIPMYVNKRGKNFLFGAWTYGRVEIQFQYMKKPPFADEERRLELAQRLTAIEGIELGEDHLGRRPTIPLEVLARGNATAQFLAVFDWVLEEIKKCED